MKYDVVALGELLIDFTYCGKSEQGRTLFEQNPGGAVANVLSAVAHLGGSSGFIGKVGADMHGEFLRKFLSENGISTEGLVLDKKFFTTLAFVNLAENGERSFSFARKPGADTQLEIKDVPVKMIAESSVFHFGSLSLTDEPSKSATLYALKVAKENGITISYDPNYRAALWTDAETAKREMRSVLPFADIIKISDEEMELLTDCNNAEAASKKLLDMGIHCVIITMGADGALVRTRDGVITALAQKAKVVDTTGAGDAFMGSFLYKMTADKCKPELLTMKDTTEYARFANATAALCIGSRGAVMPTRTAVMELLKEEL